MKRSMRRDIFWTVLTDAAILLCGIATGILTARWLLPEGRGALAATLFWPQLLAGMGLLSLGEATAYRIGSVSQSAREKIVTASLWLALILAVLTMFLGTLAMPLLLGPERSSLVSLARGYLLLFIPFNFMTLSLLAADQGNIHFVRYNLLRLFVPIVYLGGLLVLWRTDRVTVAWVVAVNCAATVAAASIRLIAQGRGLFSLVSFRQMRGLLKVAGRFHLATVLLFLGSQADEFVVLMLWDNEALGKYVVALTFASTGLAVVSGAFTKVLFPHLANMRGAALQGQLLKRGVVVASALLLALSFPLAVAIPWLVPRLFGAAFQDAAGLAQVLLVAYLFVALKTVVIQGLRGVGESTLGSFAVAFGLCLFLLLVLPLGNTWGLYGVATALGLADACALGYILFHLNKRGIL